MARSGNVKDPTAIRLEGVIATGAERPGGGELLATVLASSTVWVLGRADTADRSNKSLLHATIDGRTLVPAFTRRSFLSEAVLINPEWAAFAVMSMSGQDLMASAGSGAGIVINPWTPLEMELAKR